MLKGIDNVGVAVTDLNRSIAFYEKLGFVKGPDYEVDVKGCSMTCGSAVLFLFQTKQSPPRAVQREPTLAQNPPGLDHLSFLVEDVNKLYAELKTKGVAFLGEPGVKREFRVWRVLGFHQRISFPLISVSVTYPVAARPAPHDFLLTDRGGLHIYIDVKKTEERVQTNQYAVYQAGCLYE
jgi:catechol 2,3-dioxygenase-like lactoylglutathione lyase family enzyme